MLRFSLVWLVWFEADRAVQWLRKDSPDPPASLSIEAFDVMNEPKLFVLTTWYLQQARFPCRVEAPITPPSATSNGVSGIDDQVSRFGSHVKTVIFSSECRVGRML